MPYVVDTNYSPVGEWPAIRRFERRYGRRAQARAMRVGGGRTFEGTTFGAIAEFFGALKDDIKNAFGPPKPTVIGSDGTVYGTAKPPRNGKPGVLVPATGTMTVRDPQGRLWTCTVVRGAVTAAAPAPAGASPTAAPAVPVPSPAPLPPPLPPRGIFGGRLPTATQFAGRPIGTSATTAVAATPIAPTENVPAGSAWENVSREAVVMHPVVKPRRLNPVFMVHSG